MESSKNQAILVEEELSEIYAALFDNRDNAPVQLYDPALCLLRAYDSALTISDRLFALAEMSSDVDSLFRGYSSPFTFDGSQTVDGATTWPIALARWTEMLHSKANALLNGDILPHLANMGWQIIPVDEAMVMQGQWLSDYFKQHIYPLLTPLAVDPGRPFPYISSDSLNLLIELEGGHMSTSATRMARLKIPIITPRLVQLPVADSAMNGQEGRAPSYSIWSLDLVRHFVTELFVDIPINRIHCFRVLRTARAAPYQSSDEPVHGRNARGSVVRVDVEADMPHSMFDWLVDHLDVISYSVVRFESPGTVMSLPSLATAANKWLDSK